MQQHLSLIRKNGNVAKSVDSTATLVKAFENSEIREDRRYALKVLLEFGTSNEKRRARKELTKLAFGTGEPEAEPDDSGLEEEDDDRPDQKLQRLDPGGHQIPQEHLGIVPAHQGPQQPRHPKVGPDEPAGAGADQELDLAFGQLAISPTGTRRPGSPKISPPGPLPRTPPRTGAANPFAALLPGVHEPGPPSERTRQMRKELEKTLLQRLAEEAMAS